MSLKAVVLRTAGTNCDGETAEALRLAGAEATAVHINQLVSDPSLLRDYELMVIPGGFSYGDDIAAGKILANELRFKVGEALQEFIQSGKRVIGICNGFQVLVKTGFLPGISTGPKPSEAKTKTSPRVLSDAVAVSQTVTLATNDSGRFQCHWVGLKREKSACRWLNTTDAAWDLPIAHGEGKFLTQDHATLSALEKKGQVVFRYRGENPNGSENAIAGICNTKGNVVGLMPHPERYVSRLQHPEWTRRPKTAALPVGLQFFKAAVNG